MYFQRFQVTKGPDFIWIGILVLIAYYIIFTLLNTLALQFIRYEVPATAASSPGMAEETYPECAKDPLKAHATTSITDSVVAPEKPMASDDSPVTARAETTTKNVVIEVPDGPSPVSNDSLEPPASPQRSSRHISQFETYPTLFRTRPVDLSFNCCTMSQYISLQQDDGTYGLKWRWQDDADGCTGWSKTGGRITGDILVNGERKNPMNVQPHCRLR
ncbi:hypothetical protein PINS_up022071 [Pythium insidiosum]|nr:hypothetical protein PINS_up022071 [Pythium insidiosum]